MKNSILRTLKPGQRLQTKAADGDPLLAAVAEHAERFEKAAAASALEIKSLKTERDQQTERMNEIEQEIAEIKTKGMHGGGGFKAAPSVASQFIDSDQYKAMQESGANTTGRVTLKLSGLDLLTKAISNTGRGQTGDNAYSVQQTRVDGLFNNPTRPLSLLDVIPVIPCSAAAVEFMVLDGYVNNAGIQAKEGDVKAATAMPTAIQTANVQTIAHFLKTSTQILADGPALASQLNTLLQYGCLQKLESFVVNATGTGTKGLLSAGTAFTAVSDDPAVMVGEAAASLSAAGFVPSVIAMNSADWFAIQSKKGDSEKGYLIGSPAAPIPPSLWNVSVVTSSAIPVGTAIVMDANAGCSILQRQEVVVETSLQDGDNFTRNMATVRAELRAGVMVQSPAAVLVLDLGTAPTT